VKPNQQKESIGILFIEICKRRRNRNERVLTEAGIYEGQDMVLYRLAEQEGQTMSGTGVKKVCVQPATLPP